MISAEERAEELANQDDHGADGNISDFIEMWVHRPSFVARVAQAIREAEQEAFLSGRLSATAEAVEPYRVAVEALKELAGKADAIYAPLWNKALDALKALPKEGKDE